MQMKKNTDLNTQVIYSVYIRNHTKQGNFSAFQKDLKRIKNLGTDIIWLMPIHPIGVVHRKGELGSPYAIYDYRAINSEYGNLDDFKALVNDIHKQGMAVIIDVVLNHMSYDSILYQTHPEYFLKNDKGEVCSKASDWTDVIDFDFSNLELWDELIDTLKYWIQMGVDGFRCDVASLVPIEFWAKARIACAQVNENTIWLAESVHPHFIKEMREIGYYAESDKALFEVFDCLYDYDIHGPLKDFLRGVKAAEFFIKAVQGQFLNYPEDFLKLRFLENHDQRRLAEFVPDHDRANLLTILSFMLKGTTLVYAGQEARNAHTPDLFNKDEINWDTLDIEYSRLIKNLSDLKKHTCLRKGKFDVSAEENLVELTYQNETDVVKIILNFGNEPYLESHSDDEIEILLQTKSVQIEGSIFILPPLSGMIFYEKNIGLPHTKNKKRGSGILLHISSLPGEYGIGDFGKGAYEFIDFLADSGQKYWQILPIGITGFGDSPYQSFSTKAGNPYFIDLDELIEAGFLDRKIVEKADLGKNIHAVDYSKLYLNKMPLLKMAYENGRVKLKYELGAFLERETAWLDEFSLFMAIKAHHNNQAFSEWGPGYENSHAEKVASFREAHKEEIEFWIFTQYFFYKQWHALKSVANSKGIKIIGDLPIYVAEDSADVWANPDLFVLDQSFKPSRVAGCPPDAFSLTGQLWGNPLYNWDYMKKHGYKWWVDRISHSLEIFDTVRIDHFRGFEAYWEIPAGDLTAENGQWVKGPGKGLFKAIFEALGQVDIIAEDLGFLTQGVIDLRNYTQLPGMKVLEFAFDPREESDYLPHNYDQNFVAYTGTHDNDTIMGWWQVMGKDEKDFAIDYLNLNKYEGYHWGFIRGIWSSTAYLAIAQMQDFLGLDSKARMNYPSTLGGNWMWRITSRDLSGRLAKKINHITKLYGR